MDLEKKSIERIKAYKNEVFMLLTENPELPIVPMVDYEIVGDDCGRWLGAWGNSYIGEYFIGKERIYFRDDEDQSEIERVVIEVRGEEAFYIMTDEDAVQAYAEVPWIKAIIVNIDLP